MRSSKAIWRLRSGRALAAAALAFATLADAQRPATAEHWVATWGTAQQFYQAAPPSGTAPSAPAPPATPPPSLPPGSPARRFPVPPRITSLENETVRMIARASIGGRTVRIRLYN